MKTYTAQAFALAAYLKEHYPRCRRSDDLSLEMCAAVMECLIGRGLAGGTLGRHMAFIRKLDAVLRHLGRRGPVPTKEQGGAWSSRANASTLAYSAAESVAIVENIGAKGSTEFRDVAAPPPLHRF